MAKMGYVPHFKDSAHMGNKWKVGSGMFTYPFLILFHLRIY